MGSPMLGETMFGQICWAVRHVAGEDALAALLDGYCEGRPFAVVSDAFPEGYFPLPSLPDSFWDPVDVSERKYFKKKAWMRIQDYSRSPSSWRASALTDAEVSGVPGVSAVSSYTVHNTINRTTGTTGTGQFAPYVQSQIWQHPDQRFCIYVVLDEDRFQMDDLSRIVKWIGAGGYGRNATVGLGKFELLDVREQVLSAVEAGSRTCVTLASSVLGGVAGINPDLTFYRCRTHFGRHGDVYALSGQPFKKPVLMARTGALVSFADSGLMPFIGRGVTGISPAHPETVHQGYAPVVWVRNLA